MPPLSVSTSTQLAKPGLRFPPHLTVHSLDSGEIALLSEQESFVISGPEYVALRPYLGGSTSNGVSLDADSLVARLSDRFPPERLYYALDRLQARGLLETDGTLGPETRPASENVELTLTKCRTPPHVHVYKTTVSQSLASRRASGVLIRPMTVSGWGRTDAEARARCLSEAAERHAGLTASPEICRRARHDELAGRAVAPADLMLLDDDPITKSQVHPGVESNAQIPRGTGTADRLHRAPEIEWVAARSLQDGQNVWLPAAYCFYAQAQPVGAVFWVADSNGCAAGHTMEVAVMRGFLELVGRDAGAIWWYNRVRRPEIELDHFNDPFFAASHDALHERGRTLKTIDLTHDLGIPVVAAASWRTSDGTGLHLGLGARFELHEAAVQALGELNQLVFANDETGAHDPVPDHIHNAVPERHPTPGKSGESRRPEDIGSLQSCIELLKQRGLEIIALDQTEPPSEIRVARVVVPGLRGTGARFAPRRLYDVPVNLGWRTETATRREFERVALFPWTTV